MHSLAFSVGKTWCSRTINTTLMVIFFYSRGENRRLTSKKFVKKTMLEFSYVNFHFHRTPHQYFMTLCKINSERLLPKGRGCILNWNTSLCLAINFFPSTVLLGGLEIHTLRLPEETLANMLCII